MLNYSTISLVSIHKSTICLPFTTVLKDYVFRQVDTISEDVADRTSAAWLARALAQSTEAAFRDSGDSCSFFMISFA